MSAKTIEIKIAPIKGTKDCKVAVVEADGRSAPELLTYRASRDTVNKIMNSIYIHLSRDELMRGAENAEPDL